MFRCTRNALVCGTAARSVPRSAERIRTLDEMSRSRRPTSEQWFEAYLRQVGLDGWQHHEPDLGIAKRPDYRITSAAGDVAICEVKEFATSGLQRRMAAPSNRVFSSAPDEAYGGVRSQLHAPRNGFAASHPQRGFRRLQRAWG